MAKKKSKEETQEPQDAQATATEEAPEQEAPAVEEEVAGHEHTHEHGHNHDHDHDDEEDLFVEEPTFDIEYKGECAYEVQVSVPPANEVKKTDELVTEITDGAEIPGFRPGRAPRKLVEKKFGKHIRSEVESKLVGAAFQHLVKKEKLRPLAMPDVDGLDPKAERNTEEPLKFTLKFEVLPRVELGDVNTLAIERPVVKIKKKDVDEAIDEMRGRYSVFQTLEGGVAAEGDQVIMDFKGTVDGEPFEGGSAENYPYILGTKRFFEEFEEVLAGASPGDELECDVTLPENLPNEALRGKQAHFTINVNDVKRKELPKLDDEFAKQAGYEDVKDLRKKVKENLSESVNEHSNQVAQQRAADALVECSSFEIPKTMIESAANDILVEEMRRLYNERVPADQIQAQEAELRSKAEEDAVQEIKRVVALNKFGESEGITVTEADFEQEMQSIAARMGLDSTTVSQYFAQEEQRGTQEDRIFRAKAMEALLSRVKVTDTELKDEEDKSEQEDATSDDA